MGGTVWSRGFSPPGTGEGGSVPKVSSLSVPYAAYLRVYEPLAAFPDAERAYWERYAQKAELPSCQDELRRSLADLLPTPPIPVPVHESGDAFVAEVDGVVCVCPWRTRLRGWQALGGLADELPAPVLDAALPEVVRKQAMADFDRWLTRHPDARPWIRTGRWQVPLSWFALVADAEREWRPEPPRLRYRTPMVEARRRVARGLKALRDTVEEGALVDGLIDVGSWLEDFHPRSLVELDYGGLVHALTAEGLDEDHSAADMAAALAGLRDDEPEAAGEAYGRLVERWRAVRERQFAN
nr:hypothetical protein [Streptomyces sp. SID4945]